MAKGRSTLRTWCYIPVGIVVAALWIGLTQGNPTSAPGRDILRLDVDGVAFELASVPAGTFRMGSDEGDSDEQPMHEVCIDHEFYMGKTEVTVGQYTAFCKARGYLLDAEAGRWLDRRQREAALLRPWIEKGFIESNDHPAVCVRWHNAVAFCRWLSDRTGRHIRLPSEAEWEYACQAGSTGTRAGDLGAMAWFSDNAKGTTHPVGTKQPNAWGLYDMHGSVWEWCEDIYHRNYAGAPADGSAWVTGIDDRRVMRGGGWNDRYGSPLAPASRHLRSAYRYRLPPEHRDPAIGFRIVCDVESDAQPIEGNLRPLLEAAEGLADGGSDKRQCSESGKAALTFSSGSAGFEFVHIPAGEFDMGSETGQACERPLHRVHIERGFDMAETEVTVAQFMAFASATGYLTDVEKEGRAWSYFDGKWEGPPGVDWFQPGFEQSGDNPVVCVSWYDAVAFCQWLSKQTGWAIRLPTEAEWEYACRAGSMGDYAGDVNEMAWHGYNSSFRTHAVGTKRPNAWGLCDMHGNVWEWCEDNWHQSYEGAPADGTPWPNAANHDHVVRGGAWCRNPWVCRSAYRYHGYPDCPSINFGFRIARDCPGGCPAKTRQVPPCPPSSSR